MRYLVTYAECYDEGHADEDYCAGALALVDSEGEAASMVLFELWDSGAGYDKPGCWYRLDVYSYDGDDGDADSVYESLDAIDRGEDGDVLHVDLSVEGVRIDWHGAGASTIGGRS